MILAVALLALIGFSIYVPCRLLWAESQLRAAREALDARQLARARELLGKYLEVWPNSSPAHFLMARTARRAGFCAEAERRLDICERLVGPTGEIALERTLLAAQQGDLAQEAWLQDQLQGEPAEAELIREALCQGYRKNYLLLRMLACLNAWLKHQPDNVHALLQRAWVRERQLDFPAAVEDYRSAVRSDPDNETVQLDLASAVLRAGRPREAEQLFRRLHERRTGDPKVGLGLAQSLRALGRTEEAKQLLDRLASQHPRQFPILLELGRLALDAHNSSEAESVLRQAVALAPDDYQANYALLLCLRQRGSAEAQTYQERVQRLQTDMERITDLTDRLQHRPYDPTLRCEIGKLFLRIGEKKEGLFWLESALRADPTHQPSHLALAEYYDDSRQPTLAARHRELGRRTIN
jgi:Tfp pilus assembly protein PilF